MGPSGSEPPLIVPFRVGLPFHRTCYHCSVYLESVPVFITGDNSSRETSSADNEKRIREGHPFRVVSSGATLFG